MIAQEPVVVTGYAPSGFSLCLRLGARIAMLRSADAGLSSNHGYDMGHGDFYGFLD